MLEEKAKKLQKRKQLADEKRENDKVNDSHIAYFYTLSIFLVENVNDKNQRKKKFNFRIVVREKVRSKIYYLIYT